MRGNIQGLLAQAQKMQKNVERLQNELGNMEVTGEAGAGAVKVTTTCKHEARRVEIDAKLLTGDPDDKEMLEVAGLSVCMENGSEEMKKIADVICPSVTEDGIKKAFEKYHLM